jgi:hypothetical protein
MDCDGAKDRFEMGVGVDDGRADGLILACFEGALEGNHAVVGA